jgi:hypothetical protein
LSICELNSDNGRRRTSFVKIQRKREKEKWNSVTMPFTEESSIVQQQQQHPATTTFQFGCSESVV